MISPIGWEEAQFAMTMYQQSLAHSLRRICAMDHQTFDRMTRLFGTAGSRRTAWHALLGGALLVVTPRSAVAKPCPNVRNARCTCGETSDCEPSKCFTDGCGHQLCCTGSDRIICGNQCCLNKKDEDPCARCDRPVRPICSEGIAGSYRRRR